MLFCHLASPEREIISKVFQKLSGISLQVWICGQKQKNKLLILYAGGILHPFIMATQLKKPNCLRNIKNKDNGNERVYSHLRTVCL
jgi:hypothetical protein